MDININIMKVENKCCFVYGSLLSCFMVLVLAQVHEAEYLKPQPCGYLGNISFPFTTTQKPDCGIPIKGCDDPYGAVKQIQLTENDQWYTIDTILSNFLYHDHSIFIYYPHFDAPPQPELKKYFKIHNNITFFKCLRNYNDKDNKNSNPPKMSLYSNCDSYDIYFTSSSVLNVSFHGLPFPCLLSQSLPLSNIPTCPSCKFLFSFLEINFDVQYNCNDCHPPQQCHFNHEGICTCVPPAEKTQQAPPPTETNKPKIGLAVGIPSTVAVVALVVVILLLYKGRNKYSDLQNQSRSAYPASFRNTTTRESGALYLGINVFSYEELQEATNNFDQARELGEGGFGTVYYGKLKDGREVAVKYLFERNYRPVESFINEIQILTRLHHRNLVSLYGCTSRQSRELLLVYEYIPNGTLSSHLHGDQAKPMSLPWPVRMKIAIETASALAYLHASDIIHRDVKTSNILLDNDFGVKVADFGLSRLFPDDATHISTAPRGTAGYVDPDYRLCYQLTAKSDVYSFGVVLVELMSSLKAVDMNRSRDDINLANLALRKIHKGAFCELVDPLLGFQSDDNLKRMIVSVAKLAFRCLQGDKELRPSMGEVLEVLQRIQSEGDEPRNLEGIVVHGATRASQSYTHPPLPNTLMRPQLGLHQTH